MNLSGTFARSLSAHGPGLTPDGSLDFLSEQVQ